MSTALRMRSLFVLLVLCLCASYAAFAQTETATLSGVIHDPNGGVVPEVEVTATRIETSTSITTKTNGAGIYFFTGLMPGHYHLIVRKPGFKEIAIKEFELYVQDKLEQNFSLEIGSVSETVTVTAATPLVNTTDGSVSTVVDQAYVKNIPLNGRSFQDLILLTPGVVTVNPQNGSIPGATGEFSVNGQRTEANYYTVDGVSANIGIGPNGAGTAGGESGSVPTSTTLGTTQSLVSIDALEQFRVQSSTYSAEYGRNPGGQFSFLTRSGTNQWHGTAFDYFRNDVFDANDWFNNYLGQRQAALRQNDFGGTLGGPIQIPHIYNGRDKTFFFFSYEGLRLTQPQAAVPTVVPDANLRANAPSPLQQVLNAFPVANGPEVLAACNPATDPSCPPSGQKPTGLANFVGTWSDPNTIDSTSVRLDHVINERVRLFFRFSDTPSETKMRHAGEPSLVYSTSLATRTYTAGVTNSFSTQVTNDFRLNYSSNHSIFSDTISNFAGATPTSLYQLQGFDVSARPAPYITVGLLFRGHTTLLQQFGFEAEQKQWNLVDSLAVTLQGHELKFGIDFRKLDPSINTASPLDSFFYFSANSVQRNSIGLGSATSFAPAFPTYTNFSAFIQDEWRPLRRLSVSMGLRWEVNPAPTAAKGNLPYTLNSDLNTLAPQGTPLWATDWYNFAPRLGAAYVVRSTAEWETVLRGGGGVFFDTGQQLGSYGYSGPGFATHGPPFGSFSGSPASFPVPLAQANPAIVNPPMPPFTNSVVFAFPGHLQLPYTIQWNASVEQALGKLQALTISYVGANGRRLLEQQRLTTSPNFAVIYLTKNGRPSVHNALQIQFQRRLLNGLQALASYTWAHTIDYGSLNADLPYIRGNSDFDVRHNFTSAFSYDLPNAFQNSFARAVLHHWGFDNRLTARTGFPVTLQGTPSVDPAINQLVYPGLDLVQGRPLYIYGSECTAAYANGLGCPGGRAINPSAFCDPTAGPCPGGSAPRNFVRGFGAWQMDLAVRREFPIHERLKLQFRAEAFNVFNHPNFGTINPMYCSLDPNSPSFSSPCTFGQATATLAQSLGGLSALYQMGGPRSLQLALKLVF